MNEPQSPETNPGGAPLTTEQLANAGATSASGPEPRSFEDGDTAPAGPGAAPLLPGHEAEDLRRSWETIQGRFVDDPRRAVEDADHLVAQTMQRLAELFAKERDGLEAQWEHGGDASTEDLRLALQRYRAFFSRLLAI